MQKISVQSLLAEGLGSAWLLLCGSGTAVLAAGFPVLGVGFLGIAVAWGLGMLTASYGFGHRAVAGFTPVIAVGLWCAGELSALSCLLSMLAQIAGSLAGAGVLYLMVIQIPSFDVHQGFAGNGYEAFSPGGFTRLSVFLTEGVMAFFLVTLVLAADVRKRYLTAAGGVALTALLTVTVDNAAVSPARSLAVALFAGGEWLEQQWVFQIAPLLGAAIGGVMVRYCFTRKKVGSNRERTPGDAQDEAENSRPFSE
ncbi:UNVERIFIED_ORG: aquaporin Z [Rahnella aquatilis]